MIYINCDKSLVHISLNIEEHVFCRNLGIGRAKRDKWGKNASAKNELWRGGIINKRGGIIDPRNLQDAMDKSRAERLGLYGERAFANFTGLKVNEDILEKGDRCDFKIGDTKIEEKNHKIFYKEIAKKKGKFGPFFFRITDDNGNIKPLISDYYFFSYLNDFDYKGEIDREILVVTLYGYISREELMKNIDERIGSPLMKNVDDKWKNIYVKEEELISPIDFLWQFKDFLDLKEMDNIM